MSLIYFSGFFFNLIISPEFQFLCPKMYTKTQIRSNFCLEIGHESVKRFKFFILTLKM